MSYYCHTDRFTTSSGSALPGYKIRVLDRSTNEIVSIFSDENGTPIKDNEAVQDAIGNYTFFIAPGTYAIECLHPVTGLRVQYLPSVSMGYEELEAIAAAQAAADFVDGAMVVRRETSPALSSAIEARTFALSAQALFDDAINANHRTTGAVNASAGGYLVSEVLIPYDISTDYRGVPFRMLGAGAGESFVSSANQLGTVLRGSDATKSTVTIRKRAIQQGAGSIEWGKMRLEGTTNAGVPVLNIEGLSGVNHLHDFVVAQSGVGDGIKTGWFITSTMERFYSLGATWANTTGTRTGTGLIMLPDSDYGLPQISIGTSRGWLVSMQIGATSGGVRLLSGVFTALEASYCTDGFKFTALTEGCTATNLYAEGIDNTAFELRGKGNWLVNPYAALQFTTGIDLIGDGCGVVGGQIGLRATGATAIKMSGTAYGQNVIGTYIRWGQAGVGSNTGVGVDIPAVANPPMNLLVSFDPPSSWGANGTKIKDLSYSTQHGGSGQNHGSGRIGFTVTENGNKDLMMPTVDRGAIRLHVDAKTLVDADINVSGTLTLSASSVQKVTFTAAKTVNRFIASNLPDKTGWLFFTNGNATIADTIYIDTPNGRSIKMPPGGSIVQYQVMPGTNAVVQIMNVYHLRSTQVMVEDTLTNITALVETGIKLHGMFVTNGRKSGEGAGAGTGIPVYYDGTNLRTYYDNTVAAA